MNALHHMDMPLVVLAPVLNIISSCGKRFSCQPMHQQTCSMSNMPEHSRDCTPLFVELPLPRPHAFSAPRSNIDRGGGCKVCHPQRGVPRRLGKEYAAKEQEKRLKIDLARLKDAAASVDNPSLFWSRVLGRLCLML